MELTQPELDPTYLYKCAALLLKSKNYSAASDLYRVLLEKDIKNEEALKGYGICFYSLGNTQAALACFKGYKKLTRSQIADFWLSIVEYQNSPNEELLQKIKSLSDFSSYMESDGIHIASEIRATLLS